MNEFMDEMDKCEFRSVITEQMFNKIHQMIEEKTLSLESAIVLTKHIGCCKVMKNIWNLYFDSSSLRGRFEQMIIEEEKKIEEKNKKLFTDLCECSFYLRDDFSFKMISIGVPCILKAALNKDESEEIKKEVEMALLTLSNILFDEVPKELYLNEIKEIIQYHQEHHNLTRLAYQSAWLFLIYRLDNDKSLNEVIVNELHFGRESTKELEVLTRNVDWKRKKEEERRGKEMKEVYIIGRWLNEVNDFFDSSKLQNYELIGLLSSIVRVFRASKDLIEIRKKCILIFKKISENRNVKDEEEERKS
ncbi:uncharacterized protein MONOS_13459 [Monocercomonoides exilis]|uniref:uncharacterized protein n=1 Tax=Monocercomonoides exilis TaxID=2049356 RepID=UPI0035593D6B|nr:hypothetical protein MONOS_13459 [Monocercomonoides exilis]|eukprot:MONOS_13459.1-p1 / transcript=MONOS_13459.1 / gene=MONOS_13459 / organism=Monocercomonoides_exilis_PA203 / gene_product=unspecified product / transcript_product=unspecified product / location=Mono_scaffold00831:23573-24540(+) / protein_length=304 / sequence_SO=supercontig / SO=protein_coding / is_pseudo=false